MKNRLYHLDSEIQFYELQKENVRQYLFLVQRGVPIVYI